MNNRCDFIDSRRITSPKVKEFALYWRSKMIGGQVPPRAAIDPVEIPSLLPFLVIARIEGPPLRVRYRLVGTRIVEAHGGDYTNRYLDECHFVIEAELVECYRRLVSDKRPVFMYYEWMRNDWPQASGRTGASETGFFPLSSDGVLVDQAISAADPGIQPHHLTGA